MQAGVVFDLDDTLYLEDEYVRSGFRAVAARVARGGAVKVTEASEFLLRCHETGPRGHVFDRLIEEFPSLASRFSVRELVEAYRTHSPRIGFLPGQADFLEELRNLGVRLAIVTDGFSESQHRKVAALELERVVDETIVTDDWGREFWKPHTRAFRHLAERWRLPPHRLVYIGDNPTKDFHAPNRLGWMTVRLRLRGQLRADLDAPDQEHAPQITVTSIGGLADFVRSWIRGGASESAD